MSHCLEQGEGWREMAPLQRVPLLYHPSGMAGDRKKGVTKPLRLSHCCPNLGFVWLLPQHCWPQSPLLCRDPHALQTQEGSTARAWL